MLQPSGPPISPTCLSGEPPVAQGGPIEDGLYVLQSVVLYGSTCPAPTYFTGRATWLVCGTQWLTANDFLDPGEDASGAPPVRRWDLVQTISGSTINGLIACSPTGNSGSASWQYTVAPGHLALMYSYSAFNVYEVDTFVLQ